MQLSTYAIKTQEALTTSLFRLGEYAAALEAAERALQLGSRDCALRLHRAWSHARLGQLRDALDQCDRALAFGGAFPRPLDDHARALCVLDRAEEALQVLEVAVAAQPGDLAARCTLAILLAALGRTEDSQAVLDGLEASAAERVRLFAGVGQRALAG